MITFLQIMFQSVGAMVNSLNTIELGNGSITVGFFSLMVGKIIFDYIAANVRS